MSTCVSNYVKCVLPLVKAMCTNACTKTHVKHGSSVLTQSCRHPPFRPICRASGGGVTHVRVLEEHNS